MAETDFGCYEEVFLKFNFIKLNPSIKACYEPRLVKTGSREEVENVKGL